MLAANNRFQFDLLFQWSILKFIVQDKNGYKALTLIKEEYFDIDQQQVIAKAIKTFFKKRNRIPSKIALVEELRKTLRTKQFINAFTQVDKATLYKKTKGLYSGIVKDGDIIMGSCREFAAHVEFKKALEGVDINSFDQYQTYSNRIQKAINTGKELDDEKGTFVVEGARDRQIHRRMRDNIIATPFWQINQSTNGAGYTKGSVIVIIDKGKGGKTKVLINIARNLLRTRKKVLYIDLENGEAAIGDRIDQSIIKKSKREVLSGIHDEQLQKTFRKYRRVGGEVIIKRLPALSTTFQTIQSVVDDYYNNDGIKFTDVIVDYIGTMGSSGNQTDDNQRISNAYIEAKNFALHNGYDTVWSGHHTVREAMKRRPSRYQPNDTAKCIDVHRHVDAMWGINQSSEEEEQGIIRLELVDQRDGVQEYSCYFWDYPDIQRVDELTREAVKEYRQGMNKTKQEPSQKRPPLRDKRDLDE